MLKVLSKGHAPMDSSQSYCTGPISPIIWRCCKASKSLSSMAANRKLFVYEHLSQPVAPLPKYLQRQLRSLGIGTLFIVVALFAGMVGYHNFVGLSWIDSYENAAMILSGMGPLAAPSSFAGKFFAGSYALFSGIAVLAIAGVIAAPLVHRFLHRLHADSDESR